MKRILGSALITAIALIVLAGCTGSTAQPLAFNPAPWSDGEVSTYDLLGSSAALLGTAQWTWQQDPAGGGWTQSYEVNISGRLDRGQVVMTGDLRPLSAWRETGGQRFEATYGPDVITIVTTAANGTRTTKTLKPPADGVDNDQSLQVQRALPLAAGYVTRYTDVIPTTGVAAPIRLSVTGAETVTVPAGTLPCWRVVMDFGSGKHDGWYGQAAPYPLVKYVNRASGAAFELRSITAAGQPLAAYAGPISPAPTASAPAAGGPPALNMPLLLTSLLIQYPLMILLPLVLGWWIRRRYRVGWGVFLAGAATFILSQLVHLPLNWMLGLLGGGRGVALWPLAPLALVAGFSAGICEEGARWLVLTFFLKRVRGWRAGLQFGAGHGGAEAIIFGLLALVNFVAMIALRTLDPAALNLMGATADQVRAGLAQYWAMPWYAPALAGLERVFAIIMHITLALLVVRAIARRQVGYLLAAVGLHAAMDAWAVWSGATLGALWLEGGAAVAVLACLWLIVRWREPSAGTDAPQPSLAVAPIAARADATTLSPRVLSPEELARRADASRYE